MLSKSLDLTAAIERALPNATWREVIAGRAPGYHRACSTLGTTKVPKEREFARLRAACSIAEQYQHGLADRIGFTEFSWPAFAKLIRRVVGKTRPRETFDFDDVPGALWR